MEKAKSERWAMKPFGEIMQKVGEQMLNRPYVAGMLDANMVEPAEPVVTLDKFDCLLLVESVFALSKNVKAQNYDYGQFKRNLTNIRYRSGMNTGYPSRLHYFIDWIRDNQSRGNVTDVTPRVTPLTNTINFMSTHRASYKQLVDNANYAQIQQVEANLRGYQVYYIPKNQLRQYYPQMQGGDIIATATNIAGLDVTHTGIIMDRPNGVKGFLNASSRQHKVIVSPDLQDYSAGIPAQTGILLIRPTGR
jgi:hypothetical protein